MSTDNDLDLDHISQVLVLGPCCCGKPDCRLPTGGLVVLWSASGDKGGMLALSPKSARSLSDALDNGLYRLACKLADATPEGLAASQAAGLVK